jgi:serine protease Do
MKAVSSVVVVFATLAAAAVPPAAAQDRSVAGVRRTPVVEVVERVSPAVVNISAESIVRQPDPFFGGFFARRRRAVSLGSGLITAANGIVVTNAHVIEGASRITVTTLDGRELPAEVLGSDRDADLAVLEVDASGLPWVPLGSSADLLIGETVVAIGNPFGLSHSVTSGTLSARGRALPGRAADAGGETRFTDFLQTDAAINPGNSGGPLVNLAGEVIGINTAIISGANGIGFAIPADRARRVVTDLLRYGELQPLWTGLRLLTVDPALVREHDLMVEHGALVFRVYPDSPAAAAGFREGDVITAIAGQPVNAREDVTTAVYTAEPGRALAVEVRRGGDRRPLELAAQRPPQGLGLGFLERAVGLVVAPDGGRLVVRRVLPDSPAAAKGLRPGDVVLGANGQGVADPAHLGREVLRALDRGGLLLVVQRGRFAYNLGFPL